MCTYIKFIPPVAIQHRHNYSTYVSFSVTFDLDLTPCSTASHSRRWRSCRECKTTLRVSSAMLVGVMPTQLTYCVSFIGYQYISGWCSRRRHCVTNRAGSANRHTFHWHHTYQPAISDHLTPTGWTNHRPGLLSANDVSVTTRRAPGTLFRRLSDPLTVTIPSRPG